MALILDANVVVAACLAAGDGFAVFGSEELLAPDLMWWEVESTLHEYLWLIGARRPTPDMAGLTREDVLAAFDRLQQVPVQLVAVDAELMNEAWRVADQCGFAKVYDAAYVGLARMKRATLVTLDRHLVHSPAARLAPIVGPTQL